MEDVAWINWYWKIKIFLVNKTFEANANWVNNFTLFCHDLDSTLGEYSNIITLKGGCHDFQYLDHKSSWHWDWWENVFKKCYLNIFQKIWLNFFQDWNFTPFGCPRQSNFTPFWRPRQPNFTPFRCPRQLLNEYIFLAMPGPLEQLSETLKWSKIGCRG